MEYTTTVTTNKHAHHLVAEALKYNALVIEKVGGRTFDAQDFIKYMASKGLTKYTNRFNEEKDIKDNDVHAFLNGRMANKSLLNHLIGYYSYIKEFGYFQNQTI